MAISSPSAGCELRVYKQRKTPYGNVNQSEMEEKKSQLLKS